MMNSNLTLRGLVLSLFLCAAESRNFKARTDHPALTPFASKVPQAALRSHYRKVRSTNQDFTCSGCLQGQSIRVLFLENTNAVENPTGTAAAQAAGTGYSCGSCCNDANLARPECFVAENWNEGWVAKLISEITTELGVSVVALTPANYSAATLEPSSGSTYERCVWEVFYGTMDLCVGTFWETSPRRSLISFSSPLDVNSFSLVTRATLGSGSVSFLSIFTPFTGEVWAVMGGMFVFMAFLMWIVQSEAAEMDFDDNEVFPQPRGLAKGLWMSMMSYVAGAPFTTTSWAGRSIALGYFFFMYVSVSSYTANLASFMVLQDRAVGKIGSLQDLVDGGHTLCSHTDMDQMIVFDGLTKRFRSNSFGGLLELLLRNDCQAAVVDKYSMSTMIKASTATYRYCNSTDDGNWGQGFFCFDSASDLAVVNLAECVCMDDVDIDSCAEDRKDCSEIQKFCNVIKVSDDAFDANLNVALPISDTLEPYISAWIVSMKQEGTISSVLDSEFWTKNPATCPGHTAQGASAKDPDAASLGLSEMAGTYLISGILMTIGLVIHCVDLCLKPKSTPVGGQVFPSKDEVIQVQTCEDGGLQPSSGTSEGLDQRPVAFTRGASMRGESMRGQSFRGFNNGGGSLNGGGACVSSTVTQEIAALRRDVAALTKALDQQGVRPGLANVPE